MHQKVSVQNRAAGLQMPQKFHGNRGAFLREINIAFVLYGIVSVLVIFFLAIAVTCAFTKENAKRGALIQAMFRSNYAIIQMQFLSTA